MADYIAGLLTLPLIGVIYLLWDHGRKRLWLGCDCGWESAPDEAYRARFIAWAGWRWHRATRCRFARWRRPWWHRYSACPRCDGHGWRPMDLDGNHRGECGTCTGSGRVRTSPSQPPTNERDGQEDNRG